MSHFNALGAIKKVYNKHHEDLILTNEGAQGAGIGDVSGALAVVCVEDLPLLVHHKASYRMK